MEHYFALVGTHDELLYEIDSMRSNNERPLFQFAAYASLDVLNDALQSSSTK
jgi:hypothetical protein